MKRTTHTKHLPLLLGIALSFSAMANAACADVIVLKSGEKFTSTKVWEEDGAVRFNMNGLIVKVDKQDVASILHDGDDQANPPPPPTAKHHAGVDDPDPGPPVPAPDPGLISPRNAIPSKAPPPGPSVPHRPLKRPEKPEPESKAINATGLNGLAWQMTPEQIPGLVRVQTEWDAEGIDHYIRPDEALRLGGARLDGIVYGFRKKQLYAIMYWVAGPPGYTALKLAVRDHYGPGTQSERGLERHIWRSADTDRMLEFDRKLNTGIFWMRSRELDARLKRQSAHPRFFPARQH